MFNYFKKFIDGLKNSRFVGQQEATPEQEPVTETMEEIDVDKTVMSEEAKKALEETKLSAEEIKEAVTTHYPSHEEIADMYSSRHDVVPEEDKAAADTAAAEGIGELSEVEMERVEAAPEEMTEAKERIVEMAKANAGKPKELQEKVPVGFVGLNEQQIAELKALEEILGQVVKGVEYKNRFSADQMIQLGRLYEETYNGELALIKKREEAEELAKQPVKPIEQDKFLAYLDKALKPLHPISPKETLAKAVKAVKGSAEVELSYLSEQLKKADEGNVRSWVGYARRFAEGIAKGRNITEISNQLQTEIPREKSDIGHFAQMVEKVAIAPGETEQAIAGKLVDALKNYTENEDTRKALDKQLGLIYG